MDKKVTIIIPVYNAGANIEHCIQSILKQTSRDFKVLLINDGSTDDSLIRITEYANRYPDIFKVLTHENMGVVETRHRGIKEADTEYIMFMDNDDFIDNDYVENVIYYGKGAGRYVTASAVVSDIIKTAQTEKWQHDYEDCPNIYPITKSKYYIRANKPLDVDYEMYFTEKHDHIYITHEIELANLTTDIGDEEYIIFKVRG